MASLMCALWGCECRLQRSWACDCCVCPTDMEDVQGLILQLLGLWALKTFAHTSSGLQSWQLTYVAGSNGVCNVRLVV